MKTVELKYKFLFLGLFVSLANLHSQTFRNISTKIGSSAFCIDPNEMSGGIVVLDYNNDNYQDILILGGKSPNVLLKNNWDGTYANVSRESGVTLDHITSVGGVAGDIDNDGDLDVLITTNNNQANVLLQNNGDGTFSDISAIAGITHKSWSTSASMTDYNLDGLLDMYITNYVDYEDLPFDNNLQQCYPNFLYKNLGNNTFENVAPSLALDNTGCGLASAFSDYDNDGDMDLFVINDFGLNIEPNELYRNEYPKQAFTRVGEALNVNVRLNGMGIAIGDYDEDSDLDYYVTNIAENPFFENVDQGDFFHDKGIVYGLSNPDGTSWGAVFSDVNNDSFLDLIVANGKVIEADHQNNENRLFLGSADGSFTDVSTELGIADTRRSRGLVVSDLNNDGLNDLLFASVSTFRDPEYNTIIYQNEFENENNWIKIKLEGQNAAIDGYGTHITVKSQNRSLMKEVDGGSSYLSHCAAITHFGLGQLTSIDLLSIKWPGGNEMEIKNVPLNSFVTIREDGTFYLNQNQEITAFEGDIVSLGNDDIDRDGTYTHFETTDDGQESRVVTKLTFKEKPLEEITEVKLIATPNPTLDTPVFEYQLPKESEIQFQCYDMSGKLIAKTKTFSQSKGNHTFDADELGIRFNSGLYLFRLKVDSVYFTSKVLIY